MQHFFYSHPWSLVCGWAGAERYSNSAAIDGNPLLSACVKSHHLLSVSSAEITPGTRDPGPKACAPPRLLLYIIISFSPACSRWSGGGASQGKNPSGGRRQGVVTVWNHKQNNGRIDQWFDSLPEELL